MPKKHLSPPLIIINYYYFPLSSLSPPRSSGEIPLTAKPQQTESAMYPEYRHKSGRSEAQVGGFRTRFYATRSSQPSRRVYTRAPVASPKPTTVTLIYSQALFPMT